MAIFYKPNAFNPTYSFPTIMKEFYQPVQQIQAAQAF